MSSATDPIATCDAEYRLLLAAAEASRHAGPEAPGEAAELRHRVATYAECARAGRQRPTDFLRELRAALDPLIRDGHGTVSPLVQAAIDTYYDVGRLPHHA